MRRLGLATALLLACGGPAPGADDDWMLVTGPGSTGDEDTTGEVECDPNALIPLDLPADPSCEFEWTVPPAGCSDPTVCSQVVRDWQACVLEFSYLTPSPLGRGVYFPQGIVFDENGEGTRILEQPSGQTWVGDQHIAVDADDTVEVYTRDGEHVGCIERPSRGICDATIPSPDPTAFAFVTGEYLNDDVSSECRSVAAEWAELGGHRTPLESDELATQGFSTPGGVVLYGGNTQLFSTEDGSPLWGPALSGGHFAAAGNAPRYVGNFSFELAFADIEGISSTVDVGPLRRVAISNSGTWVAAVSEPEDGELHLLTIFENGVETSSQMLAPEVANHLKDLEISDDGLVWIVRFVPEVGWGLQLYSGGGVAWEGELAPLIDESAHPRLALSSETNEVLVLSPGKALRFSVQP